MGEEEPFFIVRNGAVWACWLSGRAAVNLGSKADVQTAMEQFLAENAGGDSVAAVPPPPPPPQSGMVIAPSPVSAPRTEPKVERGEKRHDITILGRVFTAAGSRDVTVLDLSERGCRFHDRSGRLDQGALLTIKLGPVGPVEAIVKWCEKDFVGVQFKSPLYPSVMEHIRHHFDLRR